MMRRALRRRAPPASLLTALLLLLALAGVTSAPSLAAQETPTIGEKRAEPAAEPASPVPVEEASPASPPRPSADPLPSAAERYAQGVAAYERRDFEAASRMFNALVDAGEIQPTILMAMGNSAYRRERWVAAVYAFEWARMLAPTDQDVAANLELARARLVRDEFTDEGAGGALRFREILRSVPTLWTGLAFVLLWSVGWGLLALRQRGRAEGLGAVAIAALLLALPLAAHVVFRVQDARGAERALLQSAEVEVRSGPGESYARLFTLHAGTLVAMGEERAGWRRISLPQGAEGWAPTSALAILGRPETLRER